jgi:hypothetical protein
MASLKIVLLSVLTAVVYGILHDQVTARICVEYFTVGHARLIDSESPTVLGLFWGVVATWWVGLALGIGLAIAARAGSRPKLAPRDLIPALIHLLVVMFATALVGGLAGYVTGKTGIFRLVERLATQMPPDRHLPFLVCGWTHSASYLAALIGGITLWVLVWKQRGRCRIGSP